MNFALSDEQVLLREAARGCAARASRRSRPRARRSRTRRRCPTCGRLAIEAGWPGLLIGEEQRRRRARRLRRAARGRGVWPRAGRSAAAGAASGDGDPRRAPATSRWRRSPPVSCGPSTCRHAPRATGWPAGRSIRAPAWSAQRRHAPPSMGDEVTLDGEVAFVPDAPGAELLVAIGVDRRRICRWRRRSPPTPTGSRSSRWCATTPRARSVT